jgi:hypothetical protein
VDTRFFESATRLKGTGVFGGQALGVGLLLAEFSKALKGIGEIRATGFENAAFKVGLPGF